MAGPSLISGVVPGIAPGPIAGDASQATGSIGKMMIQMVQLHEAKKAQAGENLERMMKMVEAGFPIDPKVIMKTSKQAGMPIMSPDDMKAHITGSQTPVGAQPPGSQPANSTTPQGGQPQAGGVQPVQKSLANKEQFKNAALQHWYDQAIQVAQRKGMRDQALLEHEIHIADLKNRADAGDQEALGTLWKEGEIKPPSVDFMQWQAMSDKQKQGMLNFQAGLETDKDKQVRADHITDNLQASGKITDPEVAQRAGKILAEGGSLPPDIRAAMTPHTWKELGDEAGVMGQLSSLGVSDSKLGAVAEAAAKGGLQNALPKGMKSIATKTLELRAKEVGIEEKRADTEATRARAEEDHYKQMLAAMDIKAKDEKAKAALDTFKSLVEIHKADPKNAIDPAIMKEAQAKVAQTMGVDITEVNDMFHWLTGGTHYEFKPKAATSGMPGSAGSPPPNKAGQQDFVGNVRSLMKKLKPQEAQ